VAALHIKSAAPVITRKYSRRFSAAARHIVTASIYDDRNVT